MMRGCRDWPRRLPTNPAGRAGRRRLPDCRVRTVVRGAAAGVVLTVVGLAVAAMTAVDPAAPPRVPDTQTAPHDSSGGGPGGADGSGQLAHAAGDRRTRLGTGTGHLALRSRGGLARHAIADARRDAGRCRRSVETCDRHRTCRACSSTSIPPGSAPGGPRSPIAKSGPPTTCGGRCYSTGRCESASDARAGPAAQDAVRDACEQAVRSAHALE